jgi:hypothetical protein
MFLVANVSFLIRKPRAQSLLLNWIRASFLVIHQMLMGTIFFNNSGLVETAVDMTFDESNGSQGHVAKDVTGNEVPPCVAIKKLATREVRPKRRMKMEQTFG